MVIILIKYAKPFGMIKPLLDDHRKFLDSCRLQGKFIRLGPINPRVGEEILANVSGIWEAQSIIKCDPFYKNKVAKYEFAEFYPN